MLGLSQINQVMGIVTQTISIVTKVSGQAMNVILRSLITAVQSTISAMVAIAAGYFSTGVLAELGAIVAGFAAGLNVGVALRVLQTEAELSARFASIEATLRGLELQRAGFRARGF